MKEQATRSAYTYGIVEGIISIVDLNQGMSVTNNIENIIEMIVYENKLEPNQVVVYKDSEGEWTGFDYKGGRFIHLNATDELEAVRELKLIIYNI